MAGILSLGKIGQIAYVAADLEAAVVAWSRATGAGPFYVISHARAASVIYQGLPVDMDISLALGYWGDMQIEFIQQHDQTPSIYLNAQATGNREVHHVGLYVDNLDEARSLCAASNHEIIQQNLIGDRGEWGGVYAQIEGALIEFISLPGDFTSHFDDMKAASTHWNGRDPIRPFGQ